MAQSQAPQSNDQDTPVGLAIELDIPRGMIVISVREPMALKPVRVGVPVNHFWEQIGTLMVTTSRAMAQLEEAALLSRMATQPGKRP